MRNEKEMKVKPATSFKYFLQYLCAKQKNINKDYLLVLIVTKSLRNIPKELLKQIL